MTQTDPTLSISAVDGRYRNKVNSLAPLTSEYGLMRFRVEVECQWFVFLADQDDIPECPSLAEDDRNYVLDIATSFNQESAAAIKQFEATTNHDVKAVEYFVKERLAMRPAMADMVEWVHFCCTSEDINNTAYALMVKHARDQVMLPLMQDVVSTLDDLANEHAELGMLSRTHGQTASPTTLGKEFKNFAARLQRQKQALANTEILGKFNGAVGNFNAHHCAYPSIDWTHRSGDFLARLGLTVNPWTTQIEPHDYLAEIFHCFTRFNQILLDFDRDIWSYISIDYFKQKKVEGETGSSTMPHKINPIDFENSEGNLGIANALLAHMADKLPVSRWQRDLSDSTVLRNIGNALGHCAIAYQATLKGLSRLEVNATVISQDLDKSWEVLAEPVQTVMRKYAMSEPYEKLKAATRGTQIDAGVFRQMLTDLALPEAAHNEIADLTPQTYVGLAASLAKKTLPDA